MIDDYSRFWPISNERKIASAAAKAMADTVVCFMPCPPKPWRRQVAISVHSTSTQNREQSKKI